MISASTCLKQIILGGSLPSQTKVDHNGETTEMLTTHWTKHPMARWNFFPSSVHGRPGCTSQLTYLAIQDILAATLAMLWLGNIVTNLGPSSCRRGSPFQVPGIRTKQQREVETKGWSPHEASVAQKCPAMGIKRRNLPKLDLMHLRLGNVEDTVRFQLPAKSISRCTGKLPVSVVWSPVLKNWNLFLQRSARCSG